MRRLHRRNPIFEKFLDLWDGAVYDVNTYIIHQGDKMANEVMHRLQISIPNWQYRLLRQRARQTGQSIAGVIRELLEREARALQDVSQDPVWQMVGIVQDGPPTDASERVDEWVYDREPET